MLLTKKEKKKKSDSNNRFGEKKKKKKKKKMADPPKWDSEAPPLADAPVSGRPAPRPLPALLCEPPIDEDSPQNGRQGPFRAPDRPRAGCDDGGALAADGSADWAAEDDTGPLDALVALGGTTKEPHVLVVTGPSCDARAMARLRALVRTAPREAVTALGRAVSRARDGARLRLRDAQKGGGGPRLRTTDVDVPMRRVFLEALGIDDAALGADGVWPALQALVFGGSSPGAIEPVELSLGRNALTRLPGPFLAPERLKVLFLDNCRLREVPPQVLAAANLTALSVCNNEIEAVPGELFSRLTRLRTLYLSTNRIAELPAEAAAVRGPLRELYLHENELRALPDLRKLPELAILELSHNRFAEFPLRFDADTGGFAQLRELWVLLLRGLSDSCSPFSFFCFFVFLRVGWLVRWQQQWTRCACDYFGPPSYSPLIGFFFFFFFLFFFFSPATSTATPSSRRGGTLCRSRSPRRAVRSCGSSSTLTSRAAPRPAAAI
jgi:hypothetical protein